MTSISLSERLKDKSGIIFSDNGLHPIIHNGTWVDSVCIYFNTKGYSTHWDMQLQEYVIDRDEGLKQTYFVMESHREYKTQTESGNFITELNNAVDSLFYSMDSGIHHTSVGKKGVFHDVPDWNIDFNKNEDFVTVELTDSWLRISWQTTDLYLKRTFETCILNTSLITHIDYESSSDQGEV